MQLTTLVAESPTHPLAQAAGPLGACLRKNPDIQPHRGIDIPDAERCDDEKYEYYSGEIKRRIQPDGFLMNRRRVVRPPEDMVPSDEEHQQQQYERDRKKRDVAFQQTNYWARPTRGSDPL